MSFVWSVWKMFRFKMFFEVLGALSLTSIAFLALWEYVPIFRWGWLNLFIKGGGNIIIAPVLESSGSPSVFVRLLPPLFFATLLIALPFMAHYEERVFRRGYHEWREIWIQSVKFGLIHLFVGVPLAAAIALIGVGFFYACKYRTALRNQNKVFASFLEETQQVKERARDVGVRGEIRVGVVSDLEDEAVMTSTAYHTLYNSLLVLLLLILTIRAV
ncbi:MAG: hypothetical protein AAB362_00425 [Patescibacteria group bacterium]